jgi:hypothetical protein
MRQFILGVERLLAGLFGFRLARTYLGESNLSWGKVYAESEDREIALADNISQSPSTGSI